MKIGTREIVREIDRKSIDEYGIPGLVLMENAGRATADVIRGEYPEAKTVAVIAGRGNNGGDGFVIARHLMCAGINVTTYLISDPEKIWGDALVNFNALKNTGGNIVELNESMRKYKPADVIVDAIVGTGLLREVTGFYKKVIEFINTQTSPSVSVDIPSGLDANKGIPLGAAVRADITVTYALPKLGTSIYPGVEYTGKLYLVDITTPKTLEKDIPYELLTPDNVGNILQPRYEDTHKGVYGHLFILAGSPGKSGAAALAAAGAQRTGTGLVTVGIPKSLNPVMEQKTTEAMTEPLAETFQGTLGTVSYQRAFEILSDKKSALAIGPGISTGEETRDFLYKIIENSPVPMVIDADGLTLIAENPNIVKKASSPVVLTPHPGEMSRLAGITTEDVQKDRINVALSFSTKYNVYLVLKGARSLIATPEGNLYINTTGNAGMANGGMGDVLTGIIGGLLAQSIDPTQACMLGVYAHGLAGDLAVRDSAEAGLIATDVARALPRALKLIPNSDITPIIRIR